MAQLGFSSLKTFSPTVEDLYGQALESVARRAKYLVWSFPLDLGSCSIFPRPVGSMSNPHPRRPSPGDRSHGSFSDPAGADKQRAILIREFGTQRKASWWVSGCRRRRTVGGIGSRTGLTGICGIDPYEYKRPSPAQRPARSAGGGGIGRGWGDDILHRARLSPFASLGSLNEEERERLLSATTSVLAEALALERTRTGGLSEAKLGGRFAVHGKFGQPCPSPGCDDDLRRVSFESYEMTYCASCQTGGKILADRRLSRLLK